MQAKAAAKRESTRRITQSPYFLVPLPGSGRVHDWQGRAAGRPATSSTRIENLSPLSPSLQRNAPYATDTSCFLASLRTPYFSNIRNVGQGRTSDLEPESLLWR